MNIDIKKINKLIVSLLIIVLFVFVKIDVVDASDCSTAKMKELKKEANKINFVHNLVDEYNSDDVYTYTMNFVNFTENFYIVDSNEKMYIYSKAYTADTTFGSYLAGSIVTFKIYGAYGIECQDKLIRTVKIALPYYNPYSRYKECEGIEDFKLCKRNYNGKIESEEWFLQQVKEYKESLNEEDDDEKKEEKSFFEKVFESIKNNPVIIIVMAIIIVLLIILLIVRYIKNKNNIKVDLNLKDLEK